MNFLRENRVSIIRGETFGYPDIKSSFRPSQNYPEYYFPGHISNEPNEPYDILRKALFSYGLDKENFGSSLWNPFGKMIKPGDKVLIKPNLVLHRNDNKNDKVTAVYTNPSLVAAVIDYILIASKGQGSIIIGDAPLQECVFEELTNISGYQEMIKFYNSRGIHIRLVDFRNVKTLWDKGGIHINQFSNDDSDAGTIVKLNEESAFYGMTKEHLKRLRVPNYDPRIIREHHNEMIHEYKVASQLLDADVVINMPKPKTHRKAGMTAALKNLVGICSNKEFLPHHTIGGKKEGGDAYLHTDYSLTESDRLLDEKNILVAEGKLEEAKEINMLQNRAWQVGIEKTNERYCEGAWYGNDTIWRTISDLNKILYYADKKGNMQDKPQRKVFIIADMIISGEKEGPLAPTSKNAGIVAVGENPVYFDRTICALMGFDPHILPSLNNKFLSSGRYKVSEDNVDPVVLSNRREWDGAEIETIKEKHSLKYIPSSGWELLLGNPLKDELLKKVENVGLPACIFGAGYYGKGMCTYIKQRGLNINVVCFFDNDKSKWDQYVIDDIICKKPFDVKGEYSCIISVTHKHMAALKKSARQSGFENIFCYEE